MSMSSLWFRLCLALIGSSCLVSAAPDRLELRQGDHIAFVGNTLAERFQHYGWLETLIHQRYPEHELVFRNLGFAGDELKTRLRSQDFGTPDEWLGHVKADVVLAFFGFNESFAGEAGLPAFRRDLGEYLDHLRGQDFSGKGAPRVVLFSPIAQERHEDPKYPTPEKNAANLEAYTRAMGEVAREKGVQFVDLLEPSRAAYGRAKESLTVNGIHLRDAGYEVLSPVIYRALFGESAQETGRDAFSRLRSAVLEKNSQWFGRYRTVDGYNVYGGRSHLEYDGVKNRDTMLKEMEVRDVMTANRDRRVWAVARGGDLEVRDDNLPEVAPVVTNKPGSNDDGTHTYLSGEEAIQKMKLAPGCEVNLFASEEQFPDLVNPVQMAFDTRGRLWVAAWPNYPERTPWSTKGDSLLVLEDVDGDGKADKCTPFIDDLNAPTGFQFYRDGVILVQAPDVWFVRDTDGDGRADWKERVVSGLDSADSHHTANALALDPGGAIYFSDGVFHRTQIETAWGVVRNNDAAIFRFEPGSGRFETYIPYGFANPHGRVFDRWGVDLVTDATGNNTYYGPAFSGRLDYPQKHSGLRQFWDRPSRPCAGTGLLTSRHFPEEFRGNFLNCNVIGFQGIYRVRVDEEGSGVTGTTLEPLVQSSDPNFRPTSVGVAPDGSVIFLDWHNPIVGHMQHHLRDPSRDHAHGRVYRVTYAGSPLLTPPQVHGASIKNLLELLRSPEDDVRIRAKIELGARDSGEVMAAVRKWASQFSREKLEDQPLLMEALWVMQWHHQVDQKLLRQMLVSPEWRARAAAVRVLCYVRDEVKDVLDLLRVAANDSAPRVRLEAVRAASFFEGDSALEVAHEILKHETDYYLEYTFKETLRQLQPAGAPPFLPKDPVALDRVLQRLNDAELARAEGVAPVLEERLLRPGYDLNTRNTALMQLVELQSSDRTDAVLAALRRVDTGRGDIKASGGLGQLLLVMPDDLAARRGDLLSMARGAAQRDVRSAAWAAVVAADGGEPGKAWADAGNRDEDRLALMGGIVLFLDPAVRARFAPQLKEVLDAGNSQPDLQAVAIAALPLLGEEHAGYTFGRLCEELRRDKFRVRAARALLEVPRAGWQGAGAREAAEAILAWAGRVPAADRTSQGYVEVVQAGSELAGLLPAEVGRPIQKGLLDLGVRVFVIKTVREAMRYDITRLVVEAGKPFEVILENQDMMPHNLVFSQPGSREEVGKQAETMSPNPDRQGRVYVPNNPKIWASSKLLEPGAKETLKLTAPEKPGTYDYLCTYPEHWRVMFGELVVVADAEALLQASRDLPPAPVAAEGHVHGVH